MKNDRLRRFVRKIVKESFDKEDWTSDNVFTYLVRKGVDPFEFGMWIIGNDDIFDDIDYDDSFEKIKFEQQIELGLKFAFKLGKEYIFPDDMEDTGFYTIVEYLVENDYDYAFTIFHSIINVGFDNKVNEYKRSSAYKANRLQ